MHMFPTPDKQPKVFCGGDLETALNICLGNLVNLSARAQAFHWNVEGPEFHQYHQFFQVVYEDLYESVDGFAENILMAGYSLPMSLKKMLAYSTLQCDDVEPTPESLSRSLYESNKKCIEDYTSTVKLAESLEKDLGFVSAQIELQKKWDWQLRTIIKDADSLSPTPVTHINVDIEVEVLGESDKSGALDKIFRQELDPRSYDTMIAAVAPEDCPPATQDIVLNLDNRKKAIDGAMYGPLNPAEPNDEYWQELASEWNVDADTARQQTCANCAMFNISDNMKSCIEAGVTGDRETDDFDAIDAAGELGYCEAFDFKCASARTCRAWVGGGPITAVGGHQAPSEVLFDPKTEESLKKKVEEINERSSSDRRTSLSVLKAVYRRGALSYPETNRSEKTRDGWATDRVTAFSRLVKSGRPSNSSYTHDNDLLPPSHPSFSPSEASIVASGSSVSNSSDYAAYVSAQLQPDIRSKSSDYASVSDAILSLTEISGLGYGTEVAFKAAWMRAINEGSDPYARVKDLALNTYSSKDADLLPEKVND
jgi:starvation-inducible DNA-binding protein